MKGADMNAKNDHGPTVGRKIAIYGAGGHAREIAWVAESLDSHSRNVVVCMIDDNPAHHGELVDGIQVVGLHTAQRHFSDAEIIGGVGDPTLRKRLMHKAAEAEFGFTTLIHSSVHHSSRVQFEAGVVVFPGCVLTTNIEVGAHVHINAGCTISHDVSLGAFTTLAPGAHVSGLVHIGERVWIGTGASIINGRNDRRLRIGDDAVIGAGACVTGDIPPGVTAVGVPARPLLT
jgi:sugar O-acyltransferase (sialic acid O-acetyltransferase NeuD family)